MENGNKERIIKFLIEDEQEAIRGYNDRIDSFTPEERTIIQQIINDELRHIDLLKNMCEKRRLFGD